MDCIKQNRKVVSLFLSLLLILSLLLSACGGAGLSQAEFSYMENALRLQLPAEAAETEALKELLASLYVNEGDTCAFRMAGIYNGVVAYVEDLLAALCMAEKTGLCDEAFRNEARQIVLHIQKETNPGGRILLFMTQSLRAAYIVEKLALQEDMEKINAWIQDHTDQETGLIDNGINHKENLWSMLMDTAHTVLYLNRAGLQIDTESFHKGAEAYYRSFEFKMPDGVAGASDVTGKMMESGGTLLWYMKLLGAPCDFSRHRDWWETWRDKILSQADEKTFSLYMLNHWMQVEACFSEDSFRSMYEDHINNMDLGEYLSAAVGPQEKYIPLYDGMEDLPLEKKEAIMEFCRGYLQRYKDHCMPPTIRDSYYGAALAKATGFSVDWEKLLRCCSQMLEEELNKADHATYDLTMDCYYLALLGELLKDSLASASLESLETLLKRCTKSCMEEAVAEEALAGDDMRALSELSIALGISTEQGFLKLVRKTMEEASEFDIENYIDFVDYYQADWCWGLKKFSGEDLEKVLSRLSVEGLYKADTEEETSGPDLRASYWASCGKSLVEALRPDAEERSRLSAKAAACFEGALDSWDLANVYYYLCLKYYGQATP